MTTKIPLSASNKVVTLQIDLQLWKAGFVTVRLLGSLCLVVIVFGRPAVSMMRVEIIFKLGVILDAVIDL